MNFSLSRSTGRIILLLAVGLLIGIRFPGFFDLSGTKVIEPYGDGFKSYATVEYHARHDSSYSHYEGMNYPYGEHVVPADTQPFISNVLKLISTYIVDVTPWTKLVIHLSMLISLVLCAWFLFLILEKLGLPVWWCILAAIGITFLSPQIYRMGSHYGLGHTAVLPAVMYLLMRLDETRHWKYSAWIAVVVTIFSLIHFYYFAIITFCVSFYFLFGFLRKPGWKRLFRYAWHYALQIILPLLFFFWWMYAGDSVTDRTNQPWGFFNYKSIWEGVFTSMTQPHFQWIDQHWIKIQESDFEGKAYVGLVAGMLFLILLVRWIAGLFKKPMVQTGGEYQPFLNKIYWSAIVLLLFSFSLPFGIPGMEWLLEYTGPLKQFRSVGRFNWLFFYAMNVIAFAELGAWIEKAKWRLAIGVLAIGMLFFEAWHFNTKKDLRLDVIRELEKGQQYTDIPGVNYKELQAILPIPYYNIGSDNIWYAGSGSTVPRSLILGLQTGLPSTGAMLTRTSLSQTLKQLELIFEPYRVPAILDDFKNEKPLLLVVSNYEYEQQQEKYAHLLEGVQLLHETEAHRLYRHPISAFQARIAERERNIRYTLEVDTLSLHPHGAFFSQLEDEYYFYQSYDSLSAEKKYLGAGALQVPFAKENVVFSDQLTKQVAEGWYVFSIWMYLNEDLYPRTWVKLEELEKSGESLQTLHFSAGNVIKAWDNGWGLLEFLFVPKKSDTEIRVSFSNESLQGQPLYLDEMLIRYQISALFRKTGEGVWYNNRWYPPQTVQK
ncbi:MAG TPA: hypothetical protein PKA00_07535 [Saprospiraceae bacterium]|nr:hypothetical protein [Saprospiraceae bacterium]HMQ82742.1 hypothetical protein [Saprospiraceae bacterium]